MAEVDGVCYSNSRRALDENISRQPLNLIETETTIIYLHITSFGRFLFIFFYVAVQVDMNVPLLCRFSSSGWNGASLDPRGTLLIWPYSICFLLFSISFYFLNIFIRF